MTNFIKSKLLLWLILILFPSFITAAFNSNSGIITGTLTDDAISSLEGVTVDILDGPLLIASTSTDSSGNYLISGLAPGSYIIRTRTPAYQIAIAPITINTNQSSMHNFALIKDFGTLSGTIIDHESLLPISGAVVAVYDGTTPINSSLTDISGNYTITNLAPGAYNVVASGDLYSFSINQETIVANTTTNLNFQLNPFQGTIVGTLTDRSNDQPLYGMFVLVLSENNFVTFSLTDENGQYVIEGLAPGSYNVIARKRGFASSNATANIEVGNTTTQDFDITPIPLPPESIKGTIVFNKFPTTKDRIHTITWSPSPSNCVQCYQIFRDGELVGTVSADQQLVFYDRCKPINDKNIYQIRTVNIFDQVSDFIAMSL